MNDIILDELRLNFKEIEKEIFGIVCAAGLSTITLMIEKLDNELLEKIARKYNDSMKSTIIHGQGKKSRMNYILNDLSTFDFFEKILWFFLKVSKYCGRSLSKKIKGKYNLKTKGSAQ